VKRYLFLALNFAVVLFSLWLHDKARVWMARRRGDMEAASRQRLAENPFARVDWIGSLLLPAYLLFRGLPVLGWSKTLDLDADKLRSPRRDCLLIALAGPVVNLLLALAGIVAWRGLAAAGMMNSPLLMQIVPFFCLANANLAVFNLLPIPPLSMAIAAEQFLGGDALSSFEEIKPYGFILLVVGVYFNFFDFITIPVSKLVYLLLGF
jgi:Zn-dependent protease